MIYAIAVGSLMLFTVVCTRSDIEHVVGTAHFARESRNRMKKEKNNRSGEWSYGLVHVVPLSKLSSTTAVHPIWFVAVSLLQLLFDLTFFFILIFIYCIFIRLRVSVYKFLRIKGLFIIVEISALH